MPAGRAAPEAPVHAQALWLEVLTYLRAESTTADHHHLRSPGGISGLPAPPRSPDR